MGFRREVDLVDVALSSECLRALFEPDVCPMLLREIKGLFGVPDAVYTSVDVVAGEWTCEHTTAFEMKLRNWRRALLQAFRYRSFAHASYVVLDAAHARPALQNLERFQRSKVGLITIDESGFVTVVFQPEVDTPVCERMTRKFIKAVETHIAAM